MPDCLHVVAVKCDDCAQREAMTAAKGALEFWHRAPLAVVVECAGRVAMR